MKKQQHVYSYSPASGVEAHAMVEQRRDWIVIQTRPQSIFTMLLRKSDLDAGLYYYTTPALSITAFIKKGQTALTDVTRAEGHAGWRDALRDARKVLCQMTPAPASTTRTR